MPMIEHVVKLVLDESKWLSTAMLLSIIAVLILINRQRRQSLPPRLKILEAMNLFYGSGTAGKMDRGAQRVFGNLFARTRVS